MCTRLGIALIAIAGGMVATPRTNAAQYLKAPAPAQQPAPVVDFSSPYRGMTAPTASRVITPAYGQVATPAYGRVVSPSYGPAVTPSYRPAAPAGGDAYGFLSWLNATRARHGLAPVSYDPSLAGWAAANNAQQQGRGLGHHVMGSARFQNSAVGNAASIGGQWMNSPAHRAALLNPSIRWIGLAGSGMYWTFNAR